MRASTTKRPHRARRKATADAVAGTFASLLALWAFYPVDVWKTKIQASSRKSSTISSSSNTAALQCWTRLFAGWRVKTLHTISSSFCYFYLYSWIFSWWKQRRRANGSQSQHLPVSTRLFLSALAAMLNTCITLPLDVLSAQRQMGGYDPLLQQQSFSEETSTGGDYETPTTSSDEEDTGDVDGNFGTNKKQRYHEQQRKMNEQRAKRILRKSSLSFIIEDYSPFWKGIIPSLLLCSNPAIHYTVFDVIKAQVLKARSSPNLSMPQAFLLGIVAKFVATIATYPLIRAKVMLMVTTRTETTTSSPIQELWKCLVDEYKENGVGGLYRGCQLQLFHTLLKSALLMMMRERIARTTHRMMANTGDGS